MSRCNQPRSAEDAFPTSVAAAEAYLQWLLPTKSRVRRAHPFASAHLSHCISPCLLGPPAFLARPTAILLIGAAPESMDFPVACSQVLGTGTGDEHGEGIKFHRRWSPLDIGAAIFNDFMHGAPLPPYPIPRTRPCKPIPHPCAIVLFAPLSLLDLSTLWTVIDGPTATSPVGTGIAFAINERPGVHDDGVYPAI